LGLNFTYDGIEVYRCSINHTHIHANQIHHDVGEMTLAQELGKSGGRHGSPLAPPLAVMSDDNKGGGRCPALANGLERFTAARVR